MKLFWIIIAIFALAAAGMVWAQSRAGQGSVATVRPHAAAPRPVPGEDPLIARTPVRMDDPVVGPREDDAKRQVKDEAPVQIDEVRVEVQDEDEPDQEELAQKLIDDLLGEDEDVPPMVATTAGKPGHEHQEPVREPNPWEGEAAAAGRAPIEHSVEEQPNGSTLVDGLFTMKGAGTPDSPYEITWDYLMSAAETYQPRLGMNDLPERIKMLDGKHVKIAGFLMFPMASFEAKEALIMLNMWDGCCIGTMPSPYDAIEVQFTRGIPASTRQFASYGSVEGKLVVDPYLISDWLIGLYVLEDATLHVGM